MTWGTLEMPQELGDGLGDPGDVLGTLKMPWRFPGDALEVPWGHLLPSSLLTLAVVGDDSNGEVDLARGGTGCGADGVVAGLEQGQLGEEQSSRQPHRGELLQHLQQCRAPEPLPLLVQPRILQGTRWASATALHPAGRDPQVPGVGRGGGGTGSSPVSQTGRGPVSEHPSQGGFSISAREMSSIPVCQYHPSQGGGQQPSISAGEGASIPGLQHLPPAPLPGFPQPGRAAAAAPAGPAHLLAWPGAAGTGGSGGPPRPGRR